jgi:hypothetical protein
VQQLVNYVFWDSLHSEDIYYYLRDHLCNRESGLAYQRVMNDIQRTRLSRRRRILILLPPPLPSESCLSFSVFLGVASRAYTRERGEEPNQQQNLCCDTDPHLFCSAGSGSRRARVAHKKRRNFKISMANVRFYSSGMKTSPLDVLYDSLGLG